MNKSRAIAIVLGNPRDHEHPVTEEANAPMMPFNGTLSTDDYSCSQTCQINGAKMLIVEPQEAYTTLQRHGVSEHLGMCRCYAC